LSEVKIYSGAREGLGYTRVSNKDIEKIKSQLDNLQIRGGGDD